MYHKNKLKIFSVTHERYFPYFSCSFIHATIKLCIMFVQFCCFVCSGKDILDIFNILRHTDKYIKIFLRNYLFICKKLLQPYLFVLYCVMEQYDKIIAICKLASKLFWYSTFYLLSVMHPLSMYLPYSRL